MRPVNPTYNLSWMRNTYRGEQQWGDRGQQRTHRASVRKLRARRAGHSTAASGARATAAPEAAAFSGSLADLVEVVCHRLCLNPESHIAGDGDAVFAGHRNDAAAVIRHNRLNESSESKAKQSEGQTTMLGAATADAPDSRRCVDPQTRLPDVRSACIRCRSACYTSALQRRSNLARGWKEGTVLSVASQLSSFAVCLQRLTMAAEEGGSCERTAAERRGEELS